MTYGEFLTILEGKELLVKPTDWRTRKTKNPLPITIIGKGHLYNLTPMFSKDFINREVPSKVVQKVFEIFNIKG